jgi:nitrogen fixation NifU-like protein
MNEETKEFLRRIVHEYGGRTMAPITGANREADGDNPVCGDRLHLALRVEGGIIAAATFTARACAICNASAALLGELVVGRTETEAASLVRDVRAFLDSERESEDPRLRFFGVVRALTSRRQCAWLPWGVLGGLTGHQRGD